MINQTKKISNLELSSLILFETITTYFGINIHVLIKYTGINAWISVIISYILGFIPLLLLLYISNYEKDLSIQNKINSLFKKSGHFINIIIALVFIIFSATLLYNINCFVTSQFLYRTPMTITSLIYIILIIYCTIKGINSITRTSFILVFFNILIFIISFISLIKYIKIDNFLPILENGIKSPILLSLKTASINYLPLLTILIIPKNKITNSEKYNKTIILSYLIGCLISFLIVITTIGALGQYLAKSFEFPEYIVLKRVSLFGFLERIENITSNQWIIGNFIYLSMLIYYIGNTITIKKRKLKNSFYITIGIIIYIISNTVFHDNTFFNNFNYEILPYITGSLLIIYILISLKIFIKKENS